MWNLCWAPLFSHFQEDLENRWSLRDIGRHDGTIRRSRMLCDDRWKSIADDSSQVTLERLFFDTQTRMRKLIFGFIKESCLLWAKLKHTHLWWRSNTCVYLSKTATSVSLVYYFNMTDRSVSEWKQSRTSRITVFDDTLQLTRFRADGLMSYCLVADATNCHLMSSYCWSGLTIC